jgi:hypothetical protein
MARTRVDRPTLFEEPKSFPHRSMELIYQTEDLDLSQDELELLIQHSHDEIVLGLVTNAIREVWPRYAYRMAHTPYGGWWEVMVGNHLRENDYVFVPDISTGHSLFLEPGDSDLPYIRVFRYSQGQRCRRRLAITIPYLFPNYGLILGRLADVFSVPIWSKVW